MEKTLTIDGKQIRFKHTGGTLMRYRNQFNSEFFADLAVLNNAQNDPTKINFAVVENMIWAFAKTANERIPDPQTWYDSFEEIDILEVWSELSELTAKALKTLQKNV